MVFMVSVENERVESRRSKVMMLREPSSRGDIAQKVEL